ncbi:hypothetical protein Ancab_028124 [Ancistrocladus abbreviatus]
MKQQMEEAAKEIAKIRLSYTPPPPPPPPLPPKRWAAMKPVSTWSVTKQEIEKFWKKKQMEEEDHLLAAIKAAARIRIRNLTEEDYKQFEESVTETGIKEDDECSNDKKEQNTKEIRVGIKDWWTKSKYAYLNQPAIDTTDKPRRASSYIPSNFCFYNPPTSSASTQPAYLGVF